MRRVFVCYSVAMSRILIRHGLSRANAGGDEAFGRPNAELLPVGREAARNLTSVLEAKYGILPGQTPVATSELLRTAQTAREAGFSAVTPYRQLNEVIHGMDLLELRHMLREERQTPVAAIQQAELILASPPEEKIWFTHGLVILGLYAVLGLERDSEARYVPDFCEIIELPIV
jgi:broad specificity phosphatase PhoE